MEKWKDIKGYENMYQISNKGRIKSLARTIKYKNGSLKKQKEKILSPVDANGYKSIMLSKNGKTKHYYIHRLVAQAFIDNYSEKLEVNHIDFNKSNNNVNNLECITKNKNMKHAFINNRIPIPPAQEEKAIICVNDNKKFKSIKEAGSYYKINCSLICNQLKGRNKSTHGKVFKYL